MTTKKMLLVVAMIVLLVVFLAWTAWNDAQIGWAHIVGAGASVLFLVLIWFWPGNRRQPTQPPP